jgi:HSP20 family molecular chaperone IbpA
MPENRIRVAPNTVAYADDEKNKLVVEFAIPGAPTETIDLKLLPDSVHRQRQQRTSSMFQRWL